MKRTYRSRRWENVVYTDAIPSNGICNVRQIRVIAVSVPDGVIRGHVWGTAGRYWARINTEMRGSGGLRKHEPTYRTMDAAFVAALERN